MFKIPVFPAPIWKLTTIHNSSSLIQCPYLSSVGTKNDEVHRYIYVGEMYIHIKINP